MSRDISEVPDVPALPCTCDFSLSATIDNHWREDCPTHGIEAFKAGMNHMRKGIIGDMNSRPIGQFTSDWIQPKWVACAERMPEQYAVVMVYGEEIPGEFAMSFAEYLGSYHWQARCGVSGPEWDFDLTVTHWAPRPAPPK